ncbi:hypothetical protein DXG03_002352 [Asterophora parasitica]|uniref:3-beta hydroxysteroid dehydrogenase/isomerase domain-containing protein n=1 Tax=Asterophora parasitica TaxID=117018 RepID=A0A9P7G302_9AGAR|nr:hypothetical protein DXG03_002352 [Asterophora parasitica]
MSWSSVRLTLITLVTAAYLAKLSTRLRGSRTGVKAKAPFTKDGLQETSYDDIDLLKSIPSSPTTLSYVVTNIRILDLNPPPANISSHSAVSFVKTDITSLTSVREALRPLSNGTSPTVIYHTAAIIRFWERFSYCWDASYEINVRGVGNVITAAQELPSAVLIYTSTGDTVIPRPKFLRIGWDLENTSTPIGDSDKPLSTARLSESCYSRTKLLAEELVSKSDGLPGLRAGIIRPG